jgi:cytochrome c oxidase subunit 2
MPTYQGQVSEDGVISLVEYIKSLDTNYRVDQTLNTTTLLPESEGKATPSGQPTGGSSTPKQAPSSQGVVKP